MTCINEPEWMAKLNGVEAALIAAVESARLPPTLAFILGQRWAVYREPVVSGDVIRATTYRAGLCARLDEAGVSGPWHETLRSCLVPAN